MDRSKSIKACHRNRLYRVLLDACKNADKQESKTAKVPAKEEARRIDMEEEKIINKKLQGEHFLLPMKWPRLRFLLILLFRKMM